LADKSLKLKGTNIAIKKILKLNLIASIFSKLADPQRQGYYRKAYSAPHQRMRDP